MNNTINQSEHKLILRERILSEARKNFREYGIKAVKMDDIARQLCISKRTLYELFQNKEELLYESVNDFYELFDDRIRKAEEKGETVIDILVDVYQLQLEEFSKSKPIFYSDLKKYKDAWSIIEKHQKSRTVMLLNYFNQGVEEGCFRPGVNYEIVSHIVIASMDYVVKGSIYEIYPIHEIYRNMQQMFLRGICTEKGLKILDRKLSEL